MAIGSVLGFLFFIIVAGCVALTIYFAYKANKTHNGNDMDKSKKVNVIAIPLAIVMVVGLVIVPKSIRTVNAGEIAVVKTLGKITNTRTAGTYFDLWITRDYEIYDAKVQQISIKTEAYTADSQPMDIDLTVQFKIQQNKVEQIALTYGDLHILTSQIEKISIERTKSILSQYKAETLIAERSSKSPEVERSIREAISDKYYVEFNAAVLTDITFSSAFEKAVEEKMTAEQEKLKAEYENEKKIAQAEAELEISRKKAEAVIAEAEGDAESQRLVAKAQADAVKSKSIEVARMLGFTILETTTDDGTEYFIDFTDKTDEQIQLILDYIKYADYMDKWDGKLPDTLVTDGGANILIPTP